MAEEKKKGFLADMFNGRTIAKAVFWSVPMFFIFGYVDNMVFDPFFFGPIHGSYANPDILAWKALLNDKLGGMHNVSGFEGNNGFLQSNFMQAILKPYKDNLDIADGFELADTGQDANAIAPMASGELPPLQLAPA